MCVYILHETEIQPLLATECTVLPLYHVAVRVCTAGGPHESGQQSQESNPTVGGAHGAGRG